MLKAAFSTYWQAHENQGECSTCQDLSTENKELKKEIKVLRFKVTRLTNKLANNQKQWVETLQEIHLNASKDHLESDCGECSEFVLGWGGKEYSKLWAIQDFAVIPICAVYLWWILHVY